MAFFNSKIVNNLKINLFKILNKFKYIFELIVSTPYSGWIITLQLVSGFFSITGIPMLIPVLEYIRTDVSGTEKQGHMEFFNYVFSFIGVGPSFYSVLIVASAFILFGQILVFVSTTIAQVAQIKLAGEYRKKLFNSYLKVDWLWLTGDKSGEMNNAIIREVELASVAHLNSQRLVIYLTQLMIFLALSLKLSFKVTLLAFVVYGFLIFINAKNTGAVQTLAEHYNEISKRLSTLTANLLQNKKFFKSSMTDKGLLGKMFSCIDQAMHNARILNLREQLQISWTFLATFTFLICLIMGHRLLRVGFSELLVVLLVFQRLSPQFSSLCENYLALNNHIPAYKSVVNRLADHEKNEEISGDEIFKFDRNIRFENVSFSYPHGKKVIKGVNFEIKPYQTVAFIGTSGVGKSTILDLILCLLKPARGTIFYGEISHDRLDIFAFRKEVAYVSQDVTLLDGTVKENLVIGCPKATDQMIEDICRKVHIDKFVNELPEGIQTEIGENGIKLSGGQRQRLGLGRALFMNPKILILDEATSDLDTETEMLIQESIKALNQSMTIIIVAHRLSTVKSADMIYVIEDGLVCEAGTYSELLNKKGRLYYLDSLTRVRKLRR